MYVYCYFLSSTHCREQPGSVFLVTSSCVLEDPAWVSQGFPLSRTNKFRSFCLGQVLQPLVILIGLHWTCPIWSIAFLHQVVQNRTQYSGCHLRNAEKSGKISPLDVLAVLLLMQPKMLLAMLTAWAHSRLPARASPACIPARSKQIASLQQWWPYFWIRNPELNPEFRWQLQTCYLMAEKTYAYQLLKCAVLLNLMLGTTKWPFLSSDCIFYLLPAQSTPTGFFFSWPEMFSGTQS